MSNKKYTLKDCEKIKVTIPMYITRRPGRNWNLLHMSFADCSAWFENRKKEIIGEVRGCLGGGVEVKIGEFTWYLSSKDLFKVILNHNKKSS